MTLKDLTEHEQDLLELINNNMVGIKKSQDRFIGRFLTAVAIGVTVFLSVAGGLFAYTDRVDTELHNTNATVDKIEGDLIKLEGDVGYMDKALEIRFPESSVFGTAGERLIKQRGVAFKKE